VETRLARLEDLDGIAAVEEVAFEEAGEDTVAPRELMRQRIELCNAVAPGWFYVVTHNDVIQGYAVYQPTTLNPGECVTWEKSSDNGTLHNTFDPKGETVFGVSIGTKNDAPDHTGDLLLRVMIEACIASGKKRFMFCSRLPGLREAHISGVMPEDYWQLKDANGSPQDGLLKYFHAALGVHPTKFLRDGYLPDKESGGHAALVVVEDLALALQCLNERIHRT
jgi:hypothetical protein